MELVLGIVLVGTIITITKESYQTKRFSIYNIKDITMLPKYKLRSEKREDKLNQILKQKYIKYGKRNTERS